MTLLENILKDFGLLMLVCIVGLLLVAKLIFKFADDDKYKGMLFYPSILFFVCLFSFIIFKAIKYDNHSYINKTTLVEVFNKTNVAEYTPVIDGKIINKLEYIDNKYYIKCDFKNVEFVSNGSGKSIQNNCNYKNVKFSLDYTANIIISKGVN